MNVKELLEKRRLLKKKKPDFFMQDEHKKKRLHKRWRKSKGSDSKMRVSRRGYNRSVQIGWSSPAIVKGLSREGLIPITVNNLEDAKKINPKTDIMVIGSAVGTKKKVAIIEYATANKIKITNFKDPSKFLADVKAKIDAKKKDKQKQKEEREKKKETAKKEAAKKKEKETKEEKKEQTSEEKKAEEKKEKDKVLMTAD